MKGEDTNKELVIIFSFEKILGFSPSFCDGPIRAED